MRKLIAFIIAASLIICMATAFAFNWNDSLTTKCDEYIVSAVKYSKVNSDLGSAYEKSPYASAAVGEYIYFGLSAFDKDGEEVDADIEYHHIGNVEPVGNIFRAKVIGDKPWVKISIVEKTDINDLMYKGSPILVGHDAVCIGDLMFHRNSDGVVTDVYSDRNVADMLSALAELGIDIQNLYAGKVCMSDDVLIANFGKICETESTARWYVEGEKSISAIPKTGDVSVFTYAVISVISAVAVMFKR